MPEGREWWWRDAPIRAIGLALLAIGIAAVRHLFGSAPARADPSAAAMGLAAIGILGCSLGGALTTLGAHIHDPIATAGRWRRRDAAEPPPEAAGGASGDRTASRSRRDRA